MKKLVAATILALAAACNESTVLRVPTSPTAERRSVEASRQSADTVRHGGMTRGRATSGGFSSGPDGPLGDMTLHGGTIMPSTVTYAIFWGAPWITSQTFVGDKITGLTSFFQGLGGSQWLNTLRQYPDGVNSFTTHSSWMGYYTDSITEPPTGLLTGTQVLTEVCAVLTNHNVTPRSDAVYVVYDTAQSPSIGGNSVADGQHFSGSCNQVTIKFAIIYNPTNHTRTNDTRYHSQITSDLADITAHEFAETVNDPLLNAWYTLDTSGEVGDKCNLAYSPTNPYVTLSNGSIWKIQGLWSNSANDANTGYTNLNGENGCVMGSAVVVGSITISGTLSGSNPVASWTVPTVSNGDAGDTRYSLYRWTSVGGTYIDADDPIATNYQGTTYLDLSRTVVGYNGTSNPGPHYDWVAYQVVASNGQTNQQSQTIYFKCGAFGKGCGQ